MGTLYAVLSIVFVVVDIVRCVVCILYKVNVAYFAFSVCCQICIMLQLSEILRETD